MFEVPSAKRLKRTELSGESHKEKRGDDGSDAENLDGTETQVPDYGFQYDFVDQDQTPHAPSTANNGQVEETFQFNLFKPTKPSTSTSISTSTKTASTLAEITQPQIGFISIRSPSPTASPSTNLNLANFQQSRPDSYYFTSSLRPSARQCLHKSYTTAAISGQAILSLSQSQPWPGTALPWRVIQLPSHPKQVITHRIPTTASSDTPTTTKHPSRVDVNSISVRETTSRHRPRPGMKRRLLLRQRAAKRQSIIDATKTKDEHEREKRNKKNRERKIKRRAKERRDKEEDRLVRVEPRDGEEV